MWVLFDFPCVNLCVNLKLALVNKVVMKDKNWCEAFGKFTGVRFPDLNPISFDIRKIKFDLNVSRKVKSK